VVRVSAGSKSVDDFRVLTSDVLAGSGTVASFVTIELLNDKLSRAVSVPAGLDTMGISELEAAVAPEDNETLVTIFVW
jgi:hypothetical protein